MSLQAQSIYQQSSVNTATPQELTLMLYNGGIKYLRLAKQALENKQLIEANNHLFRVQEILTELELGLNLEVEVSQQLALLYDFMKGHIIQANLKKDVRFIDEVLEFFIDFRDTWKQAMENVKQESVE